MVVVVEEDVGADAEEEDSDGMPNGRGRTRREGDCARQPGLHAKPADSDEDERRPRRPVQPCSASPSASQREAHILQHNTDARQGRKGGKSETQRIGQAGVQGRVHSFAHL